MLSNKTLVLLAALLVALCAALRFSDRLAPGGEAAPEAALLPGTDGRARAARIETPALSVSLRRSGARWIFAPPATGRADSRRVDLALDAALRAVALDRITERQRAGRGLGPEAFGLAEPRARLEMEGDGWRAALAVGGDTPDGAGVYVAVDGRSDIAVVDRAVLDLLPASADDLRDRTAFSEPGLEIDGLEIRRTGTNAAPVVRLERGAGGLWRVRAPYECPAHATHVPLLVSVLAGATVERFVHTPGTDAAPAASATAAIAHGLGPEEIRAGLSVWLRGEETPSEYAFGGPDPADGRRVLAASLSDGTVFTLDSTVYDAVSMPLDELRERRPFPFAPGEILSVSVRSGEGPFALVRPDAAAPWALAEPSRQPVAQEEAVRFVEALLALRDVAAEAAGPETAAPTGAVARLELGLAPPAEGPLKAVLSRRPAADGAAPPDLLVAFPERGIVHVVSGLAAPPGVFGAAAFAGLRAPAVLRLDPAAVVALSRRTPEGAAQSARRAADGTWLPEDPAAVPDAAALDAALGALEALDAAETVALFTSDSAAYGLLPPRLEITATTRDETRPVVILQLGARRPDGSAILRVKGEDAVFAVSAETAAALSAPFFRR